MDPSHNFDYVSLSLYGERKTMIGEEMEISSQEKAINDWLTSTGVKMVDPLEIVHAYFEKKKQEIREISSSNTLKKTSSLWQRRQEKVKKESTCFHSSSIEMDFLSSSSINSSPYSSAADKSSNSSMEDGF